jgi:hypothetical protein
VVASPETGVRTSSGRSEHPDKAALSGRETGKDGAGNRALPGSLMKKCVTPRDSKKGSKRDI